MMKVYGYAEKTISDKGLLEMREVTLMGSSVTLREIARFLMAAAHKMETQQSRFDHVHIGDLCEGWSDEWPDIVVANGTGVAG